MAASGLPPDSLLAYPLRPQRVGWLIGLSLAALITQAFTGVIAFHFLPSFSIEGDPASVFSLMLGLILEGVLAMFALRVAVEGFLSASAGRAHDADRHEHVDDSQAFRHLLFWFGLLVLAYFTGMLAGTGALLMLGVVLVFALPAILSLLVMDDSLLRALNPLAWFEMFQRSGAAYLLMALKLGLLAGGALAASLWLDSALPR